MCSLKTCIYTDTEDGVAMYKQIPVWQSTAVREHILLHLYLRSCSEADVSNNTCKVWQGYFCTIVL